jgi:hypothetical protein
MRLKMNMRVGLSLLIAASAAGAATAIAFSVDAIADALSGQLGRSLAFLGATVLLQLFGLKVPGRGTVGVSAVGLIGAGIALGAGPAMAIAVCCAFAQWLRRRGLAHRAVFDAANLALAAGAAALVFERVADLDGSGSLRVLAALVAGLAYVLVNIGLLCLAMASSETRSPVAIWHERFQWARFHFLAFGALALLCASSYAQLGAAALVPFVLPPILLALSMRETLERFRRDSAHVHA